MAYNVTKFVPDEARTCPFNFCVIILSKHDFFSRGLEAFVYFKVFDKHNWRRCFLQLQFIYLFF